MEPFDAAAVSAWAYPPPYDFYNMNSTPESIEELLRGSYCAVYDEHRVLAGFFGTGEAARVPAGKSCGVYDTKMVDVGIGMRPELTGQGVGYEFFQSILMVVNRMYPQRSIRLTVATFNHRAIRLYEKCGFVRIVEFPSDDVNFMTMVLNACC